MQKRAEEVNSSPQRGGQMRSLDYPSSGFSPRGVGRVLVRMLRTSGHGQPYLPSSARTTCRSGFQVPQDGRKGWQP